MGKIKLKQLEGVSPFRKVAMGTWSTAKDPSVYGIIEVDVEPTLAAMEQYSKTHSTKITLNHVIGKATAYCLNRRPELNGMIRGSKIYLRQSVKLNYLVNIPGDGSKDDKVKKATLSNCSIDFAERKSILEIANEMKEKVERVKTKQDDELAKNLNAFALMPWWMSKHYLNLASFLIYGLNLDLSFLGIPSDPFGSVMITNIGSLGIDKAWAPIVPYSRVPLLLTVGAISKRPWIIDDQIVIRKILPICITYDHRFVDGVHAAQMFKDCKQCFAEPDKYIFPSESPNE
ncbi:MAG: 2-oxo acid dehydrogenase subunit E2 [Bacteriovoracaceae bacterium]|nr:2-oxo acid dehydrogenase subunit E2 [Bacteriovoracaceae bacterium]